MPSDAAPNQNSAMALWETGVGLAKGIAWKRSRFLDPATRDDICQAALIGLWRAAERYKPSSGITFLSYAYRCISTEITHELRRCSLWGYNASSAVAERKIASLPAWLPLITEKSDYTADGDTPIYCSRTSADNDEERSLSILGEIRERVSDTQWDIIYRAYAVEQPREDIARELGMTRAEINKCCVRAVVKIRRNAGRYTHGH